jgi:hypothetical protein
VVGAAAAAEEAEEEEMKEEFPDESLWGCECLKIKPATRINLICHITLFRALTAVLILDVLNCVIYSILILMDELRRASHSTLTYLELLKTFLIILNGAFSSITYKQCLVERNYKFARYQYLIKIISLPPMLVATFV